MAGTLGLALAFTLAAQPVVDPLFEQCVKDAMLIRKEDAAKTMCALAGRVKTLEAVKTPVPCPECPPPKTVTKTNVVTLIGATTVGVAVGAIIGSLAVWLAGR